MHYLMALLLTLSLVCFPRSEFKEIRGFDTTAVTTEYNIIIVINQQTVSPAHQPVYQSILKSMNHDIIPFSMTDFMSQITRHQVFMATYENQNELLSPLFGSIHQYKQYPIRRSRYILNSERQIIEDAFLALDNFVDSNRRYRPICFILKLPSKTIYNLERRHQVNNDHFKNRRDFSLINIFHEMHKRRYLFPSILVIYPNQYSMHGMLLNSVKDHRH
jgi:hypothetical protein